MRTLLFFAFTLFPFQNFLSAQSGGYCNANGLRIYYQLFGEGDPIVIINGGPGMSSEGFIPIAKQLSRNNQTILYDQRGTGRSAMTNLDTNSFTMDLMVEDLEALRKHLKIESWIVFGHSFGGMLAGYYTGKHPDRVRGLILSSSGGLDLALIDELNIVASLPQKNQDSLRYWSDRIQAGDTSYAARLGRGRALAPAYLYDRSHVPTIAQRLTQGNRTINGLLWHDMMERNFDCKREVANFQKPVLIIHGRNDVVGISIAETAHQTFPNSKLVLIDECAHYGWLDQPETYLKAIEDYLTALQ